MVGLLATGHVTLARAQPTSRDWATNSGSSTIDYVTPRTEIAGFPVFSYNSDFGVRFGAVGSMARFGEGVKPYRWKSTLALLAAVKPDEGITVYAIRGALDVPGLYEGKLRLSPYAYAYRTTILPYYGIGNDTSSTVPPVVAGDPNRYFQSIINEVSVRLPARIHLDLPFDIVPLVVYRFDDPSAYGGSKLAQDATPPAPGVEPVALGLRPLSSVIVGGGILIDTRDNEFFPFRGHLHQIALKFIEGIPFSADIRYGQLSTSFVWFFPLRDNVTYATRALVDLQFGNVPYYELMQGGPFRSTYLIGGSAGIRGVGVGRYSGPIKVVFNQEVRSMLWNPKVLGQDIHVGAGAFLDFGRVWADYTFDAPEDGSFPGIRWGTGLAGYLAWGHVAVFRIDIAYSPTRAALTTGLPFAYYIEDNLAF
jgi:Omp85 superfamily domain